MQIAYYIPGWPPDKVPNGIVATLERLGGALEQLGHEIHFLTAQLADGSPDSRVSLINFKSTPNIVDRLRWKFDFERTHYNKTSAAIRKQLLKLSLAKKIDIFEMEETHGWVNTVANGLPIPVVTRLHGPWFTQAQLRSHQKARQVDRHDKFRIEKEGIAILSSFAVSAPSQAVLNLTQSFYGNLSGVTRVIPNPILLPIEEKVWSYENCDKSSLLFVGRFDEVKGADVLIRAFSELIKVRPDLQLNIVGPDLGVKSRGGELVQLSEFLRREVSSEVAARINCLGTLPRSEIDAIRRKATLTVIASRYETFPNTVGEAMAIGSPIVSTSVGGIPEMLENGRNAILLEADNPQALAAACLKLIESPDLAIKLAMQARIDCSNKFDPKAIAKQHAEFYADLISRFAKQKLRSR